MFAITKNEDKSAAPSDVKAEEIDQLEHLEDFVKHSDGFIPIGFVPTCFSREKQKNSSQYEIQHATVLMNHEETLYLIFKEHYNSDTLVKERTSYSGPFKMYTEYDIENLNYL